MQITYRPAQKGKRSRNGLAVDRELSKSRPFDSAPRLPALAWVWIRGRAGGSCSGALINESLNIRDR